MPWKEKTTMSQKEEFAKRALTKKTSFTSLCHEYGISRPHGYEIVKRYKAEGLRGLESRSRAPLTSPNKTLQEVEDKILEIRLRHPSWGPRKIYSYLNKKGETNLPVPSTINEIIKRNGLISEEESKKRQQIIRFEREKANELWQMDFKGHFQLSNKESCYPLTILDDYSRYSPCLYACKNESILTVKKQLICTFEQYGLPEQINVDNGLPWGNSCLVKYTKLTVWLMQLDIKVTHSRPRHPQTNGKNERFHRTLKKDLLSVHSIRDFKHAQKLFDHWRNIYNYERPHEAINMMVPGDRYRISQRKLPTKLPNIEYDLGSIVRKTNTRGYISFQNMDFLVGKAFAGYYIELKPDLVKGELVLYFGKHKIYTHDVDR